MEEADLRCAVLDTVNLRGANLQAVRFDGAELSGAILNGADLTQARGFILDSCDIRNAQFHQGSSDPWSILRRKYNGAVMFCAMLALIAAFLPYLIKVLYWSAINRSQSIVEGQSICMYSTCGDYTVLELMLGLDKEPIYWLMPSILVIYNIIRGILTYFVSAMRDEEQRSGFTPAWSRFSFQQGYKVLYKMHQIVSTIFYLAVVVFIFNSYYWLSQTVWIPVSP